MWNEEKGERLGGREGRGGGVRGEKRSRRSRRRRRGSLVNLLWQIDESSLCSESLTDKGAVQLGAPEDSFTFVTLSPCYFTS